MFRNKYLIVGTDTNPSKYVVNRVNASCTFQQQVCKVCNANGATRSSTFFGLFLVLTTSLSYTDNPQAVRYAVRAYHEGQAGQQRG